MNKYRAGGPSKATATTLCQKCLKRGHYTYECTAAQQERPYVSRPSRSQQLSNPKLAPKLSATLPPAETKLAAKSESKNSVSKPEERREPSQDRKRPRRETIYSPERKRRRSISTHSSDSVSTISTGHSPSGSRSPPSRRDFDRSDRSQGRERRVDRRQSVSDDTSKPRTEGRARGDSPQRHYSPSSHRSRDVQPSWKSRSRSPPRRNTNQGSGRRSRSRSPYRGQTAPNTRPPVSAGPPRQARERSLSPYSQRVAMTRAMNST